MDPKRFGLATIGFTLVLLNTTAASAQAPAVCSDGQCIQVGCYNIELLGQSRRDFNGQDRGPRTDAQIGQLAERIATTLDLEIVVFEEIKTDSNEWKKLKEKLASHGYKFFEGMSSDRDQYVVLSWDANEVNLQDNSAQELDVRADFDLGQSCKVEGLRKPVAGRFKSGMFDFWVVGVHLKSRSTGATNDQACNTKVRTEQCKDLVGKIDGLIASSGERDVIIVGDFNEKVDHSSFKPLTDAGFAFQAKYPISSSAKGSYVKSGLHQSNDLIDHVVLRYSDTKELVPNSFFVMPLSSADEAKSYIMEQSDHVPVFASFRIDEDKD